MILPDGSTQKWLILRKNASASGIHIYRCSFTLLTRLKQIGDVLVGRDIYQNWQQCGNIFLVANHLDR